MRRITRMLLWRGLAGFVLLAQLVVASSSCTGKPTCSECKSGEKSCSADNSALLVCRKLAAGDCWQWVMEACKNGEKCQPSPTGGACVSTLNCPTTCEVGSRRCEGEVSVACQQDPLIGCPAWIALRACSQNERCNPTSGNCESSNCQPKQPQAERRCVNASTVYWFDDCGNQGVVAEQCIAPKTCKSGQCADASCQPTQAQKEKRCVGNAIHWFDDCGNQGAIVEQCPTGQTCQNAQCQTQSCQPTQAQKEKRCVGNAIHWFDDCGNQGASIEQCPSGQTCQNAQCQASNNCGGQAQCTAGATQCQANGVQICERNAQTGCTSWGAASPCSSGMKCENGTCVKDNTTTPGATGSTCQSGADCQGKACIVGWPGGYCSTACSQGCPADSACVGLQSAQGTAYLCLKTCTQDADCRTNYSCYQQKVCVYAGGTTQGCRQDADCAANQRCETSTGKCVQKGCTSNSECASGQICQNSQCVQKGCTSNSECASGQTCQNGQCVTPPCQQDSDCPNGAKCVSGTCQGAGKPGQAGVEETRTVNVSGSSMTYILYVGKNYRGTSPAPVLLAFHGYGDSAGNYIKTSNWKPIADQYGIVLAALNKPASGGQQSGFWQTTSTSSPDVAFADAVLSDVRNNHLTDAKKLYVVGFSQGGYFSYLYGTVRATTLAGVGVQAASNPGSFLGTPARKIAFSFVVGDQDTAYSRAQQDSQRLQQAGHPVQFLGLPGQGHCCAAQNTKNSEVWTFLQQYSLP